MSSHTPDDVGISVNTKENVWGVPQHGDNMTHHEGNIKILRVRIVSGTIPRKSFFTETYYMRISLRENRQATEIHTETSTKQTGNNPKWDDEFLFRVDPTKNYALRFEVFKSCTVFTYLEIPLNHTSIDIERPGRDVASKEYTLTPKGQLQLYLAYVGNEEEIETSNENPSAPQEGRDDTYDDKDDAIDNKFEDWDPNTQYLLDTNDDGKEELTIDFEEEVIDDEEIHKDVLDKSVLECLNPEPILDRLQANADIPYTDVRDIRDEECAETRQKNLFQNVCDEETTEDKEEISNSLNEKEDDKQETRKDTEKSHTRVLNRSISTIKESMNPEPILDSLIQDEVFQNTVIRDIMGRDDTYDDKDDAIDNKFEDWDPNTQYLLDTNDDGKEELTIDFEEEVIDDEEIHKDVLDKSVLECLNPEPILDRLQANADIPYTDVRDIRDEECAETRQKHLFQNVCDEETTEDKEEISDSLNEKEDDKQETRKDTEKSHTRVLNRSISTIKESMNPEPILDSLIQDEVFQNTVIRDIMGRDDTYDDKDDAIDNKFEDWDPNTQYLLDTNDDGKEELTIDFEEEVIDDEEIHKDVLDKSVLECLNPEPILDRLQANADIPYTDVRDIRDEECAESRQKHLFQNVCDEETTEDKEEISDSLNEKEDDKQETRKDTEKSHTRVLNRSISTIKESMNPEPILDSLIQDEVFQNTVIRDIMEQTTTTKKNEAIIEKVRQNGTDVYKLFKKYLGKSQQYLLLKFIENTERGEETTDIQNELKEQTRRKLKEIRHQKSIEETSVNLVEKQLVFSIQKGKKFEGTQDIEETFGIHTPSKPSSRKCCDVVKCIFEGTVEKYSDQLIKAVKDVASIINVAIKGASVNKDNTVVMTMASASCQELRMLIKILRGDEFKTKLDILQTVLSDEYDTFCVIHDKISPEKIHEVQKHLVDQGVIDETHTDSTFCDSHGKQEVDLFCPEHDEFFCYECEKKHRMCKGLRQMSKRRYTKDYWIRSDEPEDKSCTTIKLCILPTCEVLLIDNVNKRLKKLDITYHVVGQYQFEEDDTPLDVCAVSGSKAVVTLGYKVYVVNVENTIKVERCFKTKEPCFRFDTRGNTIYYTDNKGIYKCDENGKDLDEVYSFQAQIFCYSLVVSNDSSKVIVGARKECIMIINTNKSEQSTLILEGLKDCTDLCMLSNRMLLVCEPNSLCLVDIDQGQLVRSVAVKSMELHKYRSIAFDETDSTVIVGNLAKDFITVFEVDTEDTDYKAP